MFCREVRSAVSPYLDGELSREEARRFEEHLSGCADCQHELDLVKAIPAALQTHRMLAPRPEFTRLVMQQIIVRQQLGTTTVESRTSSLSFISMSSEAALEEDNDDLENDEDEDETSDEQGQETADKTSQAKIVRLADRAPRLMAARRVKTPADYVLRFSAVAAALVLMVGLGAYVVAQTPGEGSEAPTAAVVGAIKSFADSLRAALNSPLELVIGVAVAAIVLIAVWYLVRALRANQHEPASRFDRPTQPRR